MQQRKLSPEGVSVVEAWMRGARARLRYLGLLPPLKPGEEDNYSLRIVVADPEKVSEPLDFGELFDDPPVRKGRKQRPQKRGAITIVKSH